MIAAPAKPAVRRHIDPDDGLRPKHETQIIILILSIFEIFYYINFLNIKTHNFSVKRVKKKKKPRFYTDFVELTENKETVIIGRTFSVGYSQNYNDNPKERPPHHNTRVDKSDVFLSIICLCD